MVPVPQQDKAQSPTFRLACAFLVDRLEGGAQLVHDSGGATKWGISQRAYPSLDIEHLTREQAEAIYHRDYWQPLRADEMPPALALCVFQAGVNMGCNPAALALQRAAGVAQDGRIGPDTLKAVAGAEQQHLRARFLADCLGYYESTAGRRPILREYLAGWRYRVALVAGEAGAWSVQR